MKLKGSKTEQDFREQLIASNKSLFNSDNNIRLLTVLQKNFDSMKTAYIIEWIPDQGEDDFIILINDNIIVKIELDRYNLDEEPLVDILTIDRYRIGLSKSNQIKLQVAIDLAQIDLR